MSEQDKNELNKNEESHKKILIRKKNTTSQSQGVAKTNAPAKKVIIKKSTTSSSGNPVVEQPKEIKSNVVEQPSAAKVDNIKKDEEKKNYVNNDSSSHPRNNYQNRDREYNKYPPRQNNYNQNNNRSNYNGNNNRTNGNGNFRSNNYQNGNYNRNNNGQNQQFGEKRPFNNNRNGFNNNQQRDSRPFSGNRSGQNNNFKQPKLDISATTNDKTRSRKKENSKKNDDRKDFFSNKTEIEFTYKRKEEKTSVNSVPESIDIVDVISVSDLAKKMNLKANVIISKLISLGSMFTINDKIDAETAEIVAAEFNCKVNIVSLYDETVIEEEKTDETDMEERPPIVTVMGHVDHGKTKLLDAIRHSDKASTESGGITQHIGAYSVTLENGKVITFIDTPGHEAFTMMRARGAQVTDIVILVVAADDGVMPQTIEAINHAKQANVPVIVAINKCDKPDANPDRVKQQLSDYGLLPEEWGGTTMYCNISALKGLGINELLETVVLQAEIVNLKAPYKTRASGFILESKIDQGRGAVASVLILRGTLKVGDFFVAGVYSGKIRAMWNDKGKRIKVATPSTPVEITGIESVPKAGDPFNVLETEKEAKLFSAKRKELNKMKDAESVKKLTLKDFLSQKKDGEQQEIKVIIKADVQGSSEAIRDSLNKLSNSEVKLTTVHMGVGPVNETDVIFAVASKAIIISFRVRPNPKASLLIEKEKVDARRYNIIYDIIEDIKAAMEGMIKPDLQEELIGTIEVKQVFKISKVGVIAGSFVTSGKVKRKSLIRLMRDDVQIYSGAISSLKRYKDDASEVLEGTECGISLENWKDIKVGDIMEAYEIKEIQRNLDDVEKKEKQLEEERKVAEMKEMKRIEEEKLRALLELDEKTENDE
ncbi:MAG: translation initiation factor IF-2 [Spirochaetales bacterium]|nr:translation initiation factor IF-2 [Spirochaetales bacterium]